MQSSISKIIQEVLKKYRLSQLLSQEQLAEKAGLDRTYISGFERGIRNISLLSLEKILDGLDLTYNKFFNLCLSELGVNNDEKSV